MASNDGDSDKVIAAVLQTHIPRFGDQLHLAKDGILMNDVKERAKPIDLVEFSG